MDEGFESGHVLHDQTSSRKRPAARGTAAYPRKRAVTACQTCRARRTKCDNLKPKCSFCQKSGAACIQNPTDLSSFDPASLHIIERIDQLQAEVRSAFANVAVTPSSLPPQIEQSSSIILEPVHHGLESSSSVCDVPLLPPGPEKFLDFPHIRETDMSMVSILNFSPAPSRSSEWIPAEIEELDLNETQRLLESFLNFVHVKNPILQELPTRNIVTQTAMDGLDWSPRSCLTLLICALGLIATPFRAGESVKFETKSYATSKAFFRAAQKRLGPSLVEGKLIGAQCLFLAGVYLMCIFKPLDAWRLFSQSLACCQEFVFRESDSIPVSPHHAARDIDDQIAEQAIYWSAWKSERELRHVLDLRDFPVISASPEALYPSFFPTPPTPTSAVGQCLQEPQWDRERIAWYFYLTEISLRRLRQRIIGDMLNFKPRPGQTYLSGLAQILPEWETQVTEWINALPADMNLDTDSNKDDVCKFVLRGHLHDLYEAMYWPFLCGYLFGCSKDHPDCLPGSLGSAQDDPNLAKLVQKSLSLHTERISINKPGFKHRHHGTWGMIWSCSRSASILLKVALLRKHNATSLQLPETWIDVVQDVIDLNDYWQQEAPDAHYRLPILEHALRLVISSDLQVSLMRTGPTGI